MEVDGLQQVINCLRAQFEAKNAENELLEAEISELRDQDESDKVAALKRAIDDLTEQNEQVISEWKKTQAELETTRGLLDDAISVQQPHGHEDDGSADHTDEPQPVQCILTSRPHPAISVDDLNSATMALAAMPNDW